MFRQLIAVLIQHSPQFYLVQRTLPTGSLYMRPFFLRLLTSDGDGMEQLRDDFAQIAAYAVAN
jgi:hypothetical protein